jgi:hypothetical protein
MRRPETPRFRGLAVLDTEIAACLAKTISDDGRGFDFEEGYRKSGHWGLKNMQERAAQSWRQGEASNSRALPADLRSVSVYSGEIGLLQVWIIAQDVILIHTGCQHFEHVPHGYPQAADASLSRALTGYNRDP